MYVEFSYLYRDASNYKNSESVIFLNDTGMSAEELTEAIQKLFEDGEYFVAENLDLETCYFGGIYDDDHGYHEFFGLEEINYEPKEWKIDSRPMSQFLAELKEQQGLGWPVAREIVDTEHGFEVIYH